MPCYQIVLVSVKFKVGSADRLKKALERLGFRISENWGVLNAEGPKGNFGFDLNQDKVDFERGLSSEINEIKQEYSKVSLEEIAKKKKWFLKEKGTNKFAMVKY